MTMAAAAIPKGKIISPGKDLYVGVSKGPQVGHRSVQAYRVGQLLEHCCILKGIPSLYW
jgi:hypothetical protein